MVKEHTCVCAFAEELRMKEWRNARSSWSTNRKSVVCEQNVLQTST